MNTKGNNIIVDIIDCNNTKFIGSTYFDEYLLVIDNNPYVIPENNANKIPIIFTDNDPKDIIIIPVNDNTIFINPPLLIFSFNKGENNIAITGPV